MTNLANDYSKNVQREEEERERIAADNVNHAQKAFYIDLANPVLSDPSHPEINEFFDFYSANRAERFIKALENGDATELGVVTMEAFLMSEMTRDEIEEYLLRV